MSDQPTNQAIRELREQYAALAEEVATLRAPRPTSRFAAKLRGRRSATSVALITLLLLTAPLVLASDRFIDVPPEPFHHDDISVLANSGVTVGCGTDPETSLPIYCPNNAVTRAQMASFLVRGLGHVSSAGFAASVPPDNIDHAVGQVIIAPGFPPTAVGAINYLDGRASITVVGPEAGCPCVVWAALYDATEAEFMQDTYVATVLDNFDAESLTVVAANPATVPGPHTVQLIVRVAFGYGAVEVDGQINVNTVPFGSVVLPATLSDDAPGADRRTP